VIFKKLKKDWQRKRIYKNFRKKAFQTFATKKEIRKLKEEISSLKEMIQDLTIAIDKLVKAIENLPNEYFAIKS
jgi:predicted  nucleic acid-binding Zn-ribbon protein